MSGGPVKVKGRQKANQRIRHETTGTRIVRPDDSPPRGWIQPNGKFVETNQHWEAISLWLKTGGEGDPAQGERDAQVAYARGWVSIGHGGAFNAIGHEDTFEATDHPAVLTLRRLVAKTPHLTLRIEKQIGEIDPATGRHEDFDVTEYDLEIFIRRGRLRKI